LTTIRNPYLFGYYGLFSNIDSLVGWALPTIIVSSFILRQYPRESPPVLHPSLANTSLSQHNDEMSNTASPSVHLQSDALPDCNGCNHNEPKSPAALNPAANNMMQGVRGVYTSFARHV
jgi:hypothetical protein